jgi:hypothetical protein
MRRRLLAGGAGRPPRREFAGFVPSVDGEPYFAAPVEPVVWKDKVRKMPTGFVIIPLGMAPALAAAWEFGKDLAGSFAPPFLPFLESFTALISGMAVSAALIITRLERSERAKSLKESIERRMKTKEQLDSLKYPSARFVDCLAEMEKENEKA